MISVKAEMAKRELELIKDRTMRGRRDKLKRGLLAGQGNELYGYRKNREMWKREIHENEAEVVRRIFEEASEGKSRRAIAKDLDLDSIPTPSQSIGFKRQGINWQPNTVRTIIRNPAYKGEDKALFWTVDGDGKQIRNDADSVVSLPNVTPAIIDAETWNRANEALDKTSSDYTRNETTFILLRGLVWCLKCGRKGYVMKRGSTRSIDLFRCSSIARGSACGSSTVSCDWLSQGVWNEVRKIIRNPESLREMIAELSDSESHRSSLIKDRERYEQRIEEIEKKTQRLVRMLAKLEPDATTEALFETEIMNLAQQRRGVEDSLAHVRGMLAEVESTSLDVPGLIELHNQFSWGDEDWSDEKKRDYLTKLDYRIYFDGRSFELRLRTGKVVAQFDEPAALIARGGGYDPGDSDGIVRNEFSCKRSSRSRTTSGRRAMCR